MCYLPSEKACGHQQNPPVLTCGWQITQVVLHSGRIIIVILVIHIGQLAFALTVKKTKDFIGAHLYCLSASLFHFHAVK